MNTRHIRVTVAARHAALFLPIFLVPQTQMGHYRPSVFVFRVVDQRRPVVPACLATTERNRRVKRLCSRPLAKPSSLTALSDY